MHPWPSGPDGGAVFRQQLGDIGTRHDDALVALESIWAEPSLASEISSRYTQADAPLKQLVYVCRSRGADLLIRKIAVRGKPERMQRQVYGFVARIGGAMPIGEPGGAEHAHTLAYEMPQGGAGGARRANANQARPG